MSAVLKSISVCAAAAVPPAASSASPETRSRRLSEPFSKRDTRSEMIASMAASFPRKQKAAGPNDPAAFVSTSSRWLRLHPVRIARRHDSDRYDRELLQRGEIDSRDRVGVLVRHIGPL